MAKRSKTSGLVNILTSTAFDCEVCDELLDFICSFAPDKCSVLEAKGLPPKEVSYPKEYMDAYFEAWLIWSQHYRTHYRLPDDSNIDYIKWNASNR